MLLATCGSRQTRILNWEKSAQFKDGWMYARTQLFLQSKKCANKVFHQMIHEFESHHENRHGFSYYMYILLSLCLYRVIRGQFSLQNAESARSLYQFGLTIHLSQPTIYVSVTNLKWCHKKTCLLLRFKSACSATVTSLTSE